MIQKTIFLPFCIFLFFIVIYGLTACGYLTSIDEIIMYDTAKNMLNRNELSVSKELSGVINTVKGKDNKFYGIYAIGVSIFVIPFMLLGRLFYNLFSIRWALDPFLVFIVSGFNVMVSAVTCVYIYKICRWYKYTNFISIILCFIYGLATMAWPYTRGIFSEPLQTLAFLGAFYYILANNKNSVASVCVSAVFLGIAIISKYANVVFLPLYLAFLLFISKKRLKHILLYSICILPFIALVFLINYLKFGNPFITGYEIALPTPIFSTPLLKGLRILLLSQNKSLFLFSPILVISIFSIPPFIKKHTKSALFILIFMIILVLLYSKSPDAGGGVVWGPRFLLPIIPFLIISIGSILKKPSIFICIILCVLFIMSFSIQALGILVNFNQYQALEQRIEEKTGEKISPHIIGHFLMAKQKLIQKNEIYNSQDFGAKQKVFINQGETLTFRGLDLWYIHLLKIKGIDIIKPIIIAYFTIAFILYFIILRHSNKLDKQELRQQAL